VSLTSFLSLLKESIGLDAASVGTGTIERAVRERAAARSAGDLEAYWMTLRDSPEERQELVENVVVPETWFFRDRGAFDALSRFAWQWLPFQPSDRPLRILSVPCATGEEPYSIVMGLLDTEFPAARFNVDALDVSARAIATAQEGIYRRNSFRAADLSFRDRYFEPTDCGHRLADPLVRAKVRFRQGNLLDVLPTGEDAEYDVVFCRNLLIYFDRATQDRAVHALARLLAPKGLLFVGPSETGLLMNHDFTPETWPSAFAFRKSRRPSPSASVVSPFAPTARRLPVAVPHASPASLRPMTAATMSCPEGAASAEPDPAELLVEAERLANAGEIVAARRRCEAFVRRKGGNVRAFYLLALIEDAAGNTAGAIEHYRRVLYLEPDHQEALVHLAMLLERGGDAEGARRLFGRAKRAAARSQE
jgi:chemotaxis protein methyltransferase WspC